MQLTITRSKSKICRGNRKDGESSSQVIYNTFEANLTWRKEKNCNALNLKLKNRWRRPQEQETGSTLVVRWEE